MRKLRFFGIVLICIGIALFLMPLANNLRIEQVQINLVNAFTTECNIAKNVTNNAIEQIDINNTNNNRNSSLLKKYPVESLILIPKINMKLPIISKLTDQNLDIGPCYYDTSCRPNQKGNVIITGHRSYRYGKHFNRLGEILKNDLIILVDEQAAYTYIVTEVFVVQPDNLSIIKQSDEKIITLITCHPIQKGDKRLIIRGKMIES